MSANFSNKVLGWSKRAAAQMDYTVKGASVDFFSRLVMRTPVDTGRARGNWNVVVTSGYKGWSADYDENRFDKTGATTIERARAVLENSPGKRAYISNNTPYLVYLDKGWSNQAPHGIVQITVSEFSKIVDTHAKRVKRA